MKGTDPTIRPLRLADRDDALAVINVAAQWYREFLPEEERHEPEMTPAQWEAEAQRMTWYGAFVGGNLVGTMGLEYVRDAVLLRHAYILPEYQHQGIGTCLHEYLERQPRVCIGLLWGPMPGTTRPGVLWKKPAILFRPTPKPCCGPTILFLRIACGLQ